MASSSLLWEECPFELFDLGGLPTLGLEGWLAAILAPTLRHFHASSGSVFLLDEGGIGRLAAQCGTLRPIPSDAVVRVGEGVGGAVLADRHARIVGDPGSDPFFAGREVKAVGSIGSALVVPLVDSERTAVGLLNLSREAGSPPFGEGDLRRSEVFGGFMAMAISNARLVESVRDALKAAELRESLLQAVLAKVPGRVCVLDLEGKADATGAPLPSSPKALADAVAGLAQNLSLSGRKASIRVDDPRSGRSWNVEAAPHPGTGGILSIHEITKAMAEQAEAARNRHLTELGLTTAAVAHEMRNPLTGISAAAQMIASGEADAREYAEIVRDEAHRLAELCESLLDVARPVRVAKSATDLGQVAAEVVKMMQPEAQAKGVKLVVDLKGPSSPRPLDAGKVRQVLYNLVRNGIQASSQGGSVTIRVRGSSVVVEDTGPGIEGDLVPKLFQPFVSTKVGGTGLGLMTVQRIAEAHGGDVRLDTCPGVGTKVTVDFQRRIA